MESCCCQSCWCWRRDHPPRQLWGPTISGWRLSCSPGSGVLSSPKWSQLLTWPRASSCEPVPLWAEAETARGSLCPGWCFPPSHPPQQVFTGAQARAVHTRGSSCPGRCFPPSRLLRQVFLGAKAWAARMGGVSVSRTVLPTHTSAPAGLHRGLGVGIVFSFSLFLAS